MKPTSHVELTAVWGNDDADSTIKVSQRRWKQIQEGAEFEASAWRARLSVKVSEMRKFTNSLGYEFSSSSNRDENCGRNLPKSIKWSSRVQPRFWAIAPNWCMT